MTNPTLKPFARLAVNGEPSLAVLLAAPVTTDLGQEVLSGEPRGFAADSAVSLVVSGHAKAYAFDEAAMATWAEALRNAGVTPPIDLEELEAIVCGPFVTAMRKAYDEKLIEAGGTDAEQAEARRIVAQKLADEEAAKKAQEDADMKARADAAVALLNTDPSKDAVPVDPSATVSNAEAPDAEAVRKKQQDDAAEAEAKAKADEKASHSKRGNKNPRGS